VEIEPMRYSDHNSISLNMVKLNGNFKMQKIKTD
jgi:hypothetical protein